MWTWRGLLPAVLPWLVFELLLILQPIWAPDETYPLVGVIITAPFYFVAVGGPGLFLGVTTRRKTLLIPGAVLLIAAAGWAAIAMVASDDGQAGLAVFVVWYVGVPVVVIAALLEWCARRWASHRRPSTP